MSKVYGSNIKWSTVDAPKPMSGICEGFTYRVGDQVFRVPGESGFVGAALHGKKGEMQFSSTPPGTVTALGVRAEGSMMFWNKVYEGAMGWTSELAKFGGHAFQSDPHRIITFGGKPLQPAEVESPYIIRVAIALLMLACSIPGKSVIRNATPVRRAHPRFAENIRALGAQIEWVEGD